MLGYKARLRNLEAGRFEDLAETPTVARTAAPDRCPFVAQALDRLPALDAAWAGRRSA
jgi:hypothetical protein